jgi:hypothetical protein
VTDFEAIKKLNRLYKVIVNAKTPQLLNREAVKELGALIKATLNIINRQQANNKNLNKEAELKKYGFKY